MAWDLRFIGGPLAELDASSVAVVIDYRLLDRSGEPPEVLYLELLEGSAFSYRVVEPPLPVGMLIYTYCLLRLTDAIAFYQFIGPTGAGSDS